MKTKEASKDPIRNYLSQIGRLGGLKSSEAKAAAARANGKKPCANGKRRGRPKKKPGRTA